jgi:hypothetical protein
MQEPGSLRSVTVDLDRFAEILADRLAAIVPAGFHVEAGDGMLWYSADEGGFPGQPGDYHAGRSGTYVRENFGVYGETDEDNIVGLAVQALDELQDYVGEATGDPWPGTTRQPPPHGRIGDENLHLWYGDPDDVVLACDPIQLAAIAG